MRNLPLVAVLGDSILMEGICARLAQSHGVDLRRVADCHVDMTATVMRFRPDIILYEVGVVGVEGILSGTWEQESVCLLGLDLDCQRAILVRSTLFPLRTMSDLDTLLVQVMFLPNPLP